jgi:hypothetical protein
VIDAKGVALYAADIIYRSDAIKLHIDLLAGTRVSSRRARPAKARSAAAGNALRSCN